MKLSIVTTLYYSERTLQEFYSRLLTAVNKITGDFEIILVNDGSPDNSQKIAEEILKYDKRVKIIELSRNFGHHKAMMTGLKYVQGEYVFLIDSDLEEEPELLIRFWNKIQKNHEIDVVFGVQRNRKGNFFERISGKWFYILFNLLSNVKLTPNLCVVRLMRREYVRKLVKFRERNFIIAGLWELTGFNQESLYIDKKSTSPTTYNFFKKIDFFFDSLTSFSEKPLLFLFYGGIFILLTAFLFISKLIWNKIFRNVRITGWTSLIISIWINIGLILFSNGILGSYISKIFIETKKRPYTIIKKIHCKE